MDFEDIFGSGFLVQDVDILGHDAADQMLFFEFGEEIVNDAGAISIQAIAEFAGPLIKNRRISLEEVKRQDIFDGIPLPWAGINAIRASEILDTGECRDAGAGENGSIVGGFDGIDE